MLLNRVEILGFKSFAKKTLFEFSSPVVAIVGPNGSGKSNVAESIRFVLGEQSMKSMRGKRGEDLIWNGSHAVPRASRASVAITFDNRSRFLAVDFDEVTIERVVHRDGANEYLLNGSQVRLKDCIELLARANIGSSGHHIISQGEADRLLAATPAQRREILEDALGLKVYQYKLDESEKKLTKTDENMRQAEALLKEVSPHVRYLKRQVEKVEKTEELRTLALSRYKTYFKCEDEYIRKEEARLNTLVKNKESEHIALKEKIRGIRVKLEESASENSTGSALSGLTREIEEVDERRRTAATKAARIEGQIDALSRISERAHVSGDEVRALADSAESQIDSLYTMPVKDAVAFLRALIERMRGLLQSARTSDADLNDLKAEASALRRDEEHATAAHAELTKELAAMREGIENSREEERVHERALFELTQAERDTQHALDSLSGERARLELVMEEFTREREEVAPLIGVGVLHYQDEQLVERSRHEQDAEKRELQKMKIRLEESGVVGADEIMKEYTEAAARETHLHKELEDLTTSRASLVQLIADLRVELSNRFDSGIKSINTEFTKLFALMFDGGTAELELVEEKKEGVFDEEGEEVESVSTPSVRGIDVALTIPRKRIRSLTMLSGGERALTSIALLFAMSSVNPPPFMILDETDAALDEANSRRYADMVRRLSEKSELIVITHNRETMSRAGVLYGVTMGGDGVSKVLSVKLDEAVKVAK